MKLDRSTRSYLTTVAHQVSLTKFSTIDAALKEIEEHGLANRGLQLLDEDGLPLETLFCGESGDATFSFGKPGDAVENSLLVFMWYKLATKYEITAYFS